MGKGTDKKIDDCTKALSKLKDALDAHEPSRESIAAAWKNLMTAVNTKGGRHPGLRAPLEKAVKDFQQTRSAISTALTAANNQVAAFDTYVTDKDKKTKNPFAKKSVGTAKKFIQKAKTELAKHKVPDDMDNLMSAAESYYL